ncbi:DUF1643 domain-containing protein [Paenibacillus sp. LPE1-1-1.1]|uniref:DUF1643 domain-containing protein n=1 Tax=Paenibacillus sp. LPE1-1-1.1 TaxID=3135230 RepID=UPI003438F9F9
MYQAYREPITKMANNRAPIKLGEDGNDLWFQSVSGMERYYYFCVVDPSLDKKLTIFLYNPSSLIGKDKTINYIKELCKHHGYGSFEIVNLIPQTGGNPDLVNECFDELNLQIVSNVLEHGSSHVWVGWGGLIKGRTKVLFPTELKYLLKKHSARLIRVQYSPKNRRGKYPLHPSYLCTRKRKVPVENTYFTHFEAKHIDSY